MNNLEKNRNLGESVRSLREQGLTFSQISQELKEPLSTCYSAMKSLKLPKDYIETLKMVVKKRKRDCSTSLQSNRSCCSSSESDKLTDESLSLQTSSSFKLQSPSHSNYGFTSTTNQLLHAVNKSIKETPWDQEQLSIDAKDKRKSEERPVTSDVSSPAIPVAATAASFTDMEAISCFLPCQKADPETTDFPENTAKITSPAALYKGNDNRKVTVLEENAENVIIQKLTWALQQLENSKKPDEIVQLMNLIASAFNILNNLKIKDNSTSSV